MTRAGPPPVGVGQLRAVLAGSNSTAGWLAHLERIGPTPGGPVLPAPGHAVEALLDLAVPHEEIDPLLRWMPDPHATPGVWWLLDRVAHSVIATIGTATAPPPFPELTAALGVFARYFHLYVILAVVPHTAGYYARLGIPEAVLRHTMADVGREFAVHRKDFGSSGLASPFWLTRHLRGRLFALGRLQYDLTPLAREPELGAAITAAGLPVDPSETAVSIHIPDFAGPLSPAACQASLASARPFFDKHFRRRRVRYGLLWSWVLDPQLRHYLGDGTNLADFQRRFRLIDHPNPDNPGTLRFLFGRVGTDPAGLPRETSLQRAVLDHILGGGRWQARGGWLVLPITSA